MPTSEKYVIIPDCQIVAETNTAYLVRCKHFSAPQNNLLVHRVLFHGSAPMPPDLRKCHYPDKPRTGDLVVMKRFVINNFITVFEEII